jgi:integrase
MSCVWKSPKSRFWIAQFTDHTGRRRNRSTKTTDGRKAAKVAEHYEAAYARKRTARQIREVIATAYAEITGEHLVNKSFRSFSQSWLAAKRHEVAESTLNFYTNATDKFLTHLGALADGDLAEITREHILNFRNHEAEKFAPKTVNHDLKAVKMLFLAAKRDGLIAENPAEDVKTVSQRGEKRARRPFSLDELRAVLSVADDEWRSMILVGLYTGARLSDVASLTWENVDLTAKELRFIARKTGKLVIIPLEDGPLAAHVESLPAADSIKTPLHPRAFAIVEKQGKTGHLSNQFADLLAQAGLRKKQPHRKVSAEEEGRRRRNGDISFHSLRHTAVTLLKEAGIPQAVVMELVGHDNEQMSQHYTRVGRPALADAARAFPDLLTTKRAERTSCPKPHNLAFSDVSFRSTQA